MSSLNPTQPFSNEATRPNIEPEVKAAAEKNPVEADPFHEVRKDIKSNLSAIKKTNLIAAGIFLLLSTSLAGAATAVITFTISAVTLAGGAFACIAIALAFFKLGAWQEKRTAPFAIEADLAIERLVTIKEGSPEAMLRLFKTYGKHCKALDVGSYFETGYDIKYFLEEIISKHTIHPELQGIITRFSAQESSKYEGIILSIYTPSLVLFCERIKRLNEKNLIEPQDIETIETELKKSIRDAIREKNTPHHKNLRLLHDKELAQIIRSCPNLIEINLGACVSQEVLNACKAINIPKLVHCNFDDATNEQYLAMFEGTGTAVFYEA